MLKPGDLVCINATRVVFHLKEDRQQRFRPAGTISPPDMLLVVATRPDDPDWVHPGYDFSVPNSDTNSDTTAPSELTAVLSNRKGCVFVRTKHLLHVT